MIVALAGRNRVLIDRLRARSHTVILLPRSMGRLPGIDVVIDLTGRRTRTLLDRIRDLPRRPALFLSPDPAALAADALGVRVILLTRRNPAAAFIRPRIKAAGGFIL